MDFNTTTNKIRSPGVRVKEAKNFFENLAQKNYFTERRKSKDKIEQDVSTPKFRKILFEKSESLLLSDSDLSQNEERISRAKTIRQESIGHYDNKERDFLNKKVPQLFELAALIELKLNDRSNSKYIKKYMPVIKFSFPSNKSGRFNATLDSLPCLCFPDVNTANLDKQKVNEDEQFVMILTDGNGDRKYAYCHKFVTLKSLPMILCIVTPVQASQFYKTFSCEAIAKAKVSLGFLETFLRANFKSLLEQRLLKNPDENNQREILPFNENSPDNDMHLLLDHFNVDGMLLLFVSMLTEGRILLIGSDVPTLSKIVRSACKMMAPFSWPHTLIPVVPDSMLDYVQLPSPYFMGILRSCLQHVSKVISFSSETEDEADEFVLIYDVDLVDSIKVGKKLISQEDTVYKLYRTAPMVNLKAELLVISSSNETNPSLLDVNISIAFFTFFEELLGNYRKYIVTQKNGKRTFDKIKYFKSIKSKNTKKFLKYFVETCMFQVWIEKKINNVIVTVL